MRADSEPHACGRVEFRGAHYPVVVVSLLAALMLTALLRAWFTLAQQKRSLENLVDLDPLTNLRNRRSLHSSI